MLPWCRVSARKGIDRCASRHELAAELPSRPSGRNHQSRARSFVEGQVRPLAAVACAAPSRFGAYARQKMQQSRLLSDWRQRQGWIGCDTSFLPTRREWRMLRHCTDARPGELSRAPEASVMRGCGGDVWFLAMPIADHCLVRDTTVFVPSSAARRRLPRCASLWRGRQ